MPDFIIQSGKYQGKRLILNESRILIGRDDTCQVRITSNDVSRQHCIIRIVENGWVVKDLGSQNGTYVNDVLVKSEQPLKPGDRVRVGPMVLELAPHGSRASAKKAGREPAAAAMTEDDIVTWLSNGDEGGAAGDTTIVSDPTPSDSPPPKDRAADGPTTTAAKTPPPEKEKTFKSIAEEAADIISRHKKMVEGE